MQLFPTFGEKFANFIMDMNARNNYVEMYADNAVITVSNFDLKT